MAISTPTITSEIQPADQSNTSHAGAHLTGLVIGQRIKVVVVADKASYVASLQSNFKSGDFDSNFVGYGLHFESTAPTTSTVFDLSKDVLPTVEDTATEYKITALFDMAPLSEYMTINFRFLVNGTIEEVFYTVRLTLNIGGTSPITNIRIVDEADNPITRSQVCTGDIVKVKYDFLNTHTYNYRLGAEREDTFVNTNHAFQDGSYSAVDGEVTLDTSTIQSAKGLTIFALTKTPSAGTACAANISIDTTFTLFALDGVSTANVQLDFDIGQAVQSVLITNVSIGGNGGIQNFTTQTGSMMTTVSYTPASSGTLPDGNPFNFPQSGNAFYIISVTLADGCVYNGSFNFDFSNESPVWITNAQQTLS